MARDILIVDDEADIRTVLSGILEDEGYVTRGAGSTEDALMSVADKAPGLVILDIWLEGSGMDGLQLLDILRRDYPLVPVVMISGHGTIETAVSAIRNGAYDFIEKPFKTDRLLLVVERAFEAARLRMENQQLKSAISVPSDLHGTSMAITHVRQAIARVAPSGSRVLIVGQAGSGKEVVARLIHAHSRRADAPFVCVNCATMHPDRMEIELFGTERGYEGEQASRKIGVFEQADGGTLLLDEIGDMPLETQGKIVRVLQEQTFERVGGTKKIAVDVRVIATTTRDLRLSIAQGEFREDLYYRLSVVPIHVPALQDRREDIPVLSRVIMEQAARSTGALPRCIGDDAMAVLQSYDWPGNVRQLRNVIDWLLIMAPGDNEDVIRADMLPAEISLIVPEVLLRLEGSAEIMSLPLRDAREMFEREYLLAQVTRFNGNISRTAEFIGMERSALHRKLKNLGVSSEEKVRAL
ncbi:sigma-54-dependent Fis family transcriptional regulator [Haematospirillum jordaniae]|uniref:AAA family ATPase n=1 Tax=Haematospirillum jordaniae TaxID=1549855 RepID=A0A143DEI1_9PROT|nr:sigma-54 dependent transcriptional regulator [Haematospirillum jordaniae]AMW35172.1 AAA family ATPase [Haematospirillum jordaniae]NKD46154.1 sigma-54-dependent Fis family transcriptional regulator [Haematospirillum jordaniae]NKD56434.1 sigma-54-dependent Fis family transcriptional regulator [Haematospirillum jordaniae]NKD58492.1 sigma-54-dependent Fis family transcriptional regulator [Haematospirillum jordaniae]NKD66339.1 sigma-54-dependent Fis family transcriptional regulator [Haematospiri